MPELINNKIQRACKNTDISEIDHLYKCHVYNKAYVFNLDLLIKYAKQNQKLNEVLILVQKYLTRDEILCNIISSIKKNDTTTIEILYDNHMLPPINNEHIALAQKNNKSPEVIKFLQSHFVEDELSVCCSCFSWFWSKKHTEDFQTPDNFVKMGGDVIETTATEDL